MYGDILNTNNYVTLAQYYLSPKHQTHVTLYIVKYIYIMLHNWYCISGSRNFFLLVTSTGSSQFCLEFCAFGAIIQLKKSKDEILEKNPGSATQCATLKIPHKKACRNNERETLLVRRRPSMHHPGWSST